MAALAHAQVLVADFRKAEKNHIIANAESMVREPAVRRSTVESRSQLEILHKPQNCRLQPRPQTPAAGASTPQVSLGKRNGFALGGIDVHILERGFNSFSPSPDPIADV